ncbi:MAG: peptidoglycan synthetase [Bacteroidetes bacterium RIFCSPLOWO2_02_FULL_36_8]|nr:MAG: peptidoglycan synthetase [Bacteroidetes bacterium RIFCSPLOWO2_02_FULL_36_8]OFY70393.1 MAG: peptidoglycan synthetase [Bacteroidetes bacterium RIFCSPLOWO2_12_FULL_37_12]
MPPKIHLIAIGGAVMHNLAIALKKKGFMISGSDDEINEPSYSRLKQNGLLPEKMGWDSSKINNELDAVILGMHARKDNPELLKAKEKGIKIYSFPEYVFENSRHKQRVVIAGSHGKTTVTAMIMHVLNQLNKSFDYLVGSSLEGFEDTVKLSENAPVIIIEGDEYPSHCENNIPKFHLFHHHIGVITGVAWDHFNVFPTFDDYKKQFQIFADQTPVSGTLIFSEDDKNANQIGAQERYCVKNHPYRKHPYFIKNGSCYLKTPMGDFEMKIFGEHNMKNISAAMTICRQLGIEDTAFYETIRSFKGAARRLQKITENSDTVFFHDFAHAPSKLKASCSAVKELYPKRKLVACLELHTFSSLNKNFIKQYHGTFDSADFPLLYFNPETIKHKNLPPLSENEIMSAIGNKHLKIYTDTLKLKSDLGQISWKEKCLLMMSSGNFGGLDMRELGERIIRPYEIQK